MHAHTYKFRSGTKQFTYDPTHVLWILNDTTLQGKPWQGHHANEECPEELLFQFGTMIYDIVHK
jgi:hypothetical protein